MADGAASPHRPRYRRRDGMGWSGGWWKCLDAGSRFEGAAGPGGELWFVIAGLGRLSPRTGPCQCRSAATPGCGCRPARPTACPPTAGRAQAGRRLAARRDRRRAATGADGPSAPGDTAEPRLSELGDCPVEVTGDRRFRVLFGPGNGCSAATQFVGEIPPGRAPEPQPPVRRGGAGSARARASCTPGRRPAACPRQLHAPAARSSRTAWRTPGGPRCGCSASSTRAAARRQRSEAPARNEQTRRANEAYPALPAGPPGWVRAMMSASLVAPSSLCGPRCSWGTSHADRHSQPVEPGIQRATPRP